MLPFVTFVAFDLETTGLSPLKDEIIEIAGVKFTLEKNAGRLAARSLGSYNSLIKPNMYIPKEATKVNNITDQMVENAPPAQKAINEFLRFCGISTILVAHNAAFDAEFLAKAVKRLCIRMPGNPVVDSIKLSKKVLMEAGSHALGNLAKKLRNEIDIRLENSELHRALYDCEVLKEVFTACLRKRFQEKDLAMDKAVQSIEKIHGPTLQFKSFA